MCKKFPKGTLDDPLPNSKHMRETLAREIRQKIAVKALTTARDVEKKTVAVVEEEAMTNVARKEVKDLEESPIFNFSVTIDLGIMQGIVEERQG